MMWCSYKVAVLVLLSALCKGQLPEDDFRIINSQDLLSSNLDIFEDRNSNSFSQLLFDVARDQVIVGARDAIYRLTLRGLRLIEKADWPADETKIKLCQEKGQTEEDCHNYIKVLLSHGHRLFVCGTNAFSPECSWREIESIRNSSHLMTGVASCPYNPHSNVTAILSTSGEYYAGTPTDFTSSDTAICRSRGAGPYNVTTLRTTQYDQNWLNEPQFVGSFEDDYFVYFVFREVAVEFMNCGKTIYSRIARVCKNDSGGYVMGKNNWSTFLKARLECPVRGDVPFHYDEVQSVEYMPQEKILVATFTTPTNSIPGSAVCIYSMADIQAAFEGPFKVQDSPTSTWEPRSPSNQAKEHFRCKPDLRPHQTIEYYRYQLMYVSVVPVSGEPVYKKTLERFTHVTVDVTSTKNAARQFVLYISTQRGDIMKLAVLPHFDGACLVEVWKLSDLKSGFDIQTMQFVKETMSVYVGSRGGVTRVGGARCDRYRSRSGCVGAADPHCAWDDARDACVRPDGRLRDPRLVQETAVCPAAPPVDGGWSSWSNWEECMQDGTSQSVYGDDKPADMCLCRTRRCDNPKPAHGGQSCKGVSISVTNCTVHGGWSAWSAWSECSGTCGIAVKSRRRACSSPAPRHHGRVCVGLDTEHAYCTSLPPCPDPNLVPVDGGWSAWGPWSECAAAPPGPECGLGWRERRRTCSEPAPRHRGAPCEGSKLDRQQCDLGPCQPHHKKATAWSPWVQIPNNHSDGGYTERRFKFICKVSSSEQIDLSVGREEVRYCTSRGACSWSEGVGAAGPAEGAEGEAWGPWGAWGACSADCGGGQQRRERSCRRPPCAGPADMLRPCNTHACTGEWSCWSEWSACAGSCAGGAVSGSRERTRRCLSPQGCAHADDARQRQGCIADCAATESGWGEWGEWSKCNNGERERKRSCPAGRCVGPRLQVGLCDGDDNLMDNDLHAMAAYSQNAEVVSFITTPQNKALSAASVTGYAVIAFLAGCLVSLIGVLLWRRRAGKDWWRRKTHVPSSPHYMTATQNSYVTVPLKDVPRKAKRQPSFIGIGGSSGILLSKSNNISNANNHNNTSATPKLYPKAIANEYDSMGTLRRHSNQPNNKSNLDVEEDKFY
ncbi:semaphorin-5A [Achroia grisella]|uniref:semaphorin-5A n=1 Tax=Achroia grisella TaxID=688607 RepID=UPI0027D2788B|nr:semaphorin-5A [Achroia grisella]